MTQLMACVFCHQMKDKEKEAEMKLFVEGQTGDGCRSCGFNQANEAKIKFFLLNPNLSLANLFRKRLLDDFSRFSDQAEMPAKPDNHPKYWSRDHQSQRLDWR